MRNGYIAVLDSGIGGLSVLEELIKLMPNENYLYFGDNSRAPYGNRTSQNLLEISMQNLLSVLPLGVKAVVFGCNTISTTVLSKLKDYLPNVEIFGTFPPVEINLLRKRKTLLLCTSKTAENYKSNNLLTVVPLCDLALDVEKNIFNISKINLQSHLKKSFDYLTKSKDKHLTTLGDCLTTEKLKIIFDHKIRYFDAVIMGCTHYFFVRDKILNHFQPQVLLGGEFFVARKVKSFLENNKSLEKTKRNDIFFFGENASFNAKVFNTFSSFNSKNIKIL